MAIKARVRSSGAKGRSFRADMTQGVRAGDMAWTRGEEYRTDSLRMNLGSFESSGIS